MKFVVSGGKKLEGELELGGSKNAATKMMVASLLTDEECILENFPQIGDVKITMELCQAVGGEIKNDGENLIIKTPDIKNFKVNSLTQKNRISILAIGPLLARAGKAEVPFVGGDKIGPRPVDMHLSALRLLGAQIEVADDSFLALAPNGLKGSKINLRYPSIGATENIIFAAVLAKGRTTIKNAAIEPEVIDLIKMLQNMGAIIGLGADRTIYIDGVKKLHGIRHRVLPDRNEAASFACLAAAGNKNKIKVKRAIHDHLITFLNEFRKVGGEYRVEDDGIVFWRGNKLSAIELETDTHPGFMTDWQQPFVILLTQADGISVIHETVYENRFGYTEDLNFMGANIKVFSKCLGELPCRFNSEGHYHSAVISGATPLSGKNLTVLDLRAGMAHLIAALIAQGESVIEGVEEIDRGYEKIDERLKKIGAEIKRI
ncbi:MAG: UDP-N-acetylglucosamine 1-carboxyvinyltransferase [Candidatus Wolfebacteria bacterium GW2011_GWC1_37_10]|nr:MAG: UDP-N-acetylglucosamine 1-carboxyvinyltransferase [Candidatus Wolfebacteria bacterium GW2011_GWC1_37_10]